MLGAIILPPHVTIWASSLRRVKLVRFLSLAILDSGNSCDRGWRENSFQTYMQVRRCNLSAGWRCDVPKRDSLNVGNVQSLMACDMI